MTARVVYWNNIPSPYVVGRFNALARRGNLDFEAWFNERREPDRSWDVREEEWHFPARYIPAIPVGGRRLNLPISELRAVRPDLLVSLHSSPSFVLGSVVARALGSRQAFRILPTYDTWVRRSIAKEATKHMLLRSADGVKVPGPDGASVARRYGVPADRIHPITQSIDIQHYSTALEIAPALRDQERRARGLHGCVFLYVGRLWSGKGLDYLIQAFAKVQRTNPDVSLLIAGDGIDEDHYRTQLAHLPNAVLEGFVQPSDLPSIYALADVFVFPTLGDPHGLVVEEALAAGLPVICTESAGDIRQRLPDGRAGYIVPPADSPLLADRMAKLAADPDLRRRFAGEGRRLVASRNHDQYARDFETFVEAVLAMPPRRSVGTALARIAGTAVGRTVRRHDPAPIVTGAQG